MKRLPRVVSLLVLLLVCLPVVTCAADAPLHPLRAAIAEQDDFADLAPLGEAIGDKRIVMLDELTHGEGNIYAYKARVVRYLHAQKDFDVLVLESGLFDVARLWQLRQPVRPLAPGNIFYMYANSAEVLPLFDYLDAQRSSARPLELAGLDGRLSGGLSKTVLVPQLHAHLSRQPLDASQTLRLARHLEQLQRLLNGQLAMADAATQVQFLQDGQWLDTLLPAPDSDHGTDVFNSDGFWRRVNVSLQRMAEVAWERRPFDEHDPVMAGNLQWLMEQAYPGRKMVVWGHYAHLNRLGGYREGHAGGLPPVDNVTRALSAALQAQTYVLHFAGARGRYLDYVDQRVIDVPIKPGLLEPALTAASPSGALFVDLQAGALPGESDPTARLWSMDYQETLSLPEARKRFDGLLLLDRITPSTYQPR
ncbi:erythromycin esterase family protein [Stenotrophomonas sp. Iso1]|uniref:erythromycin esterase family protein n=1 Tax=Stenotrophomonas sp. Iso1 TaxID=2977283 RepID=UPI0022B7C3F1|nr:erythromycin esterase family protein [Stenotrophomonas sp. Iso1]